MAHEYGTPDRRPTICWIRSLDLVDPDRSPPCQADVWVMVHSRLHLVGTRITFCIWDHGSALGCWEWPRWKTAPEPSDEAEQDLQYVEWKVHSWGLQRILWWLEVLSPGVDQNFSAKTGCCLILRKSSFKSPCMKCKNHEPMATMYKSRPERTHSNLQFFN